MSPRHAIHTDAGRERDGNEDAALAVPERGLYAIADGMGGHAGGELASRAALDGLRAHLEGGAVPTSLDEDAPLLRDAVRAADAAVRAEASRSGLVGMGTTLTALTLRDDFITVCHVGDSRLSWLEVGQLRVLTRDHDLATRLAEEGLLSASQVNEHPEHHVLMEALGSPDPPTSDLLQIRVPAGVRLLLSTDGLHDVVPAERIAELAADADLDAAARALIDEANLRGGPDNVTVVLLAP